MSDPGEKPGSIEENEVSLRFDAAVDGAQVFSRLAGLHPKLCEVVQRLASIGAAETFWVDLATGPSLGPLAPCLIALEAWVELHRGVDRSTLPLEDFLSRTDLRPEERVSGLTAPKIREHEYFCARAASQLGDADRSIAFGAFKFDIRDGRVGAARIAFSGLGERPARAAATEGFAIGLRIADEETWRSALEALPFDFSSTNEASEAARDLLRGALVELRGMLGTITG